VIGLVPHRPRLPSGVEEDRFFIVDMSGVDFAYMVPEPDGYDNDNNIANNSDGDDDDLYE
jgi:hypothetical protein